MFKNSQVSGSLFKKFISDFFTASALSQFGRYLVTGFSSFGLEYLLLYVLTEYAGLWYIASNSIAFLVSFWFNFLLNRYWSFQSRYSFPKQLLSYGVLFVINLCISNMLLYIITDVFGVVYLISKVIVIAVITPWNFIIYKKIIYI